MRTVLRRVLGDAGSSRRRAAGKASRGAEEDKARHEAPQLEIQSLNGLVYLTIFAVDKPTFFCHGSADQKEIQLLAVEDADRPHDRLYPLLFPPQEFQRSTSGHAGGAGHHKASARYIHYPQPELLRQKLSLY